jgi:hypothetical protein
MKFAAPRGREGGSQHPVFKLVLFVYPSTVSLNLYSVHCMLHAVFMAVLICVVYIYHTEVRMYTVYENIMQ